MQYTHRFFLGTGAAVYIKLGFCPAKIRIAGQTEEDVAEWTFGMPNTASIETTDSDGIRALDTTDGISLVKFDESGRGLVGQGGVPTTLEPALYYQANGIKIDDGLLPNTDTVPCFLEAWGFDHPIIRLVHDGGDTVHTYFQDSSVDLIEAGVEGGQTWIVFNLTNDNYGYIKSITRPSGSAKFCRAYVAENEAGDAAAAADFDDDDVLILIPKQMAQYPLSGVGAIT